MNKNKILLASTCALLLIVVAVLAQSFVRRNQASRVITQVKEAAAKEGNNPKALAVAIFKNKADIEFIHNHQPIINLKPQQSSAAESDECEAVWYTFMHPQEGLDNINEVFGANFGGAADRMWYQGMLLHYAAALGCAL